MKLTTVKSLVVQSCDMPGLLKGQINYEIKGGLSTVQWTGPKIPEAIWQEVLAFFKWTWDKFKAESQVRLYVNVTQGIWAAWAYPQEAKSSAATKELKNDESKKQREQFKDSDGWQYLGTAHHHCCMEAFQSGTDHANEKTQDGLHITIGNIHQARFDIHCRFYLSGCEFNPDMSEFWDVGDEVRRLIPNAILDTVARHQMTASPEPVADGARAFPEQWEKNVVEDRPIIQAGFHGGHGTNGNGAGSGHTGVSYPNHNPNPHIRNYPSKPFWERKRDAFKMVRGLALNNAVTVPEFDAMMRLYADEEIAQYMVQACNQHNVDFEDITSEWEDDLEAREAAIEAGLSGDQTGEMTGFEHYDHQ